MLGPACNQPTYFTASLTSRYLKDVQVSYSATTPLLSDVEATPLFYRTVPSYSDYGHTIYALMQQFDWLFLGVIHQEVAHYTRSLEELNAILMESSSVNNQSASVIVSLGLNSYLNRNGNAFSNARIFVAMVPENRAAETICAAYKSGMTGKKFQWILLGDYRENWWRPTNQTTVAESEREPLRCTAQEMLDGVESVLILSHNQPKPDKVATEGRDFWQEYAALVNASAAGTAFRGELATQVMPTYDAVWAIAHALNSVLNKTTTPGNIEYRGQSTVTRNTNSQQKTTFSEGRPITAFTSLLNAAMERTDFLGLSGRIRYNSSSHSRTEPLTYIQQMQGGRMVPIGIHDQQSDGGLNLGFYDNDLRFQGDSPPRDRPAQILQSVQVWVVIFMVSVAILGVVFATVVLIVNCVYRKHKVIKASSPYLNFVIALGCIMGFLAIIFMSMESIKVHFKVNLPFFPFFCNIRLWLLTIGFTLAFGALFAKTWRIYVIFRNPWKKKRPYKDYILFFMVAVFLFFDLIILSLWALVDPLVLVTAIDLDLPAFLERKYAYCVTQLTPNSNLSFIIEISIVVIPKSLLLIFGVFLVVQTSRIKAKFFRDAKFTGIAIFGCVMVCGVGVPVAFFAMFLFQEDLGYIVATSTILICCYLVLCMVFIPKFVLLHRYKNKIPSAVLIGLNPSFRIRRSRGLEKLESSAGLTPGPPMTYYARMLRGNGGSVYSRTSQSSSNSGSSSENNSSTELQAGVEAGVLGRGIGWEAAFEGDDSDGEIEVQETRLDFGGGFQYMASIDVIRRASNVSTDTMSTVVSETGHETCAGTGQVVAGTRARNARSFSRVPTSCSTIVEGEEGEVCETTPPTEPLDLSHITMSYQRTQDMRTLYVRAKSRSLTIIPSPVQSPVPPA